MRAQARISTSKDEGWAGASEQGFTLAGIRCQCCSSRRIRRCGANAATLPALTTSVHTGFGKGLVRATADAELDAANAFASEIQIRARGFVFVHKRG
eukprot:3991927-Pleurochrysis_carterae.AAC.2